MMLIAISKSRIGWLAVNLGTAILASLVIGLFGVTLEKMVALAVLMPIVASMGGNAGTQTMTVAVRALATRDLDSYNTRRIIKKELFGGPFERCGICLCPSVLSLPSGSANPGSDW